MPNNVIEIVVRAINDATAPLRDAQKSIDGIKDAVSSLAKVAGVGLSLKFVVDQMEEASDATARLAVALKSNAGFAGQTQGALEKYARELELTSTFSDEAVKRGQALLLQFRNIRGEVFELAEKAMVDLAAKMGGDVPGAAQMLGRALQDPIQGMTLLRRSGVILVESQKEQIKNFIALGDVQAAQKVILDQVAAQAGGTAEALRNTLGGALKALRNEFGNAFEGRPEDVNKLTQSVLGLTKVFGDPEFKAALDTAMSVFIDTLKEAIKLIAGVIQGWTLLIGLFNKPQTPLTAEQEAIFDKQNAIGEKINETMARIDELKSHRFEVIAGGEYKDQIEKLKNLRDQIKEVQDQIAKDKGLQTLGTMSGPHGTGLPLAIARAKATAQPYDVSGVAVEQLDEIKTGVDAKTHTIIQRLEQFRNDWDKTLADWNDDTKTAREKQLDDLTEFQGKLSELFDAGVIDAAEYAKRTGEEIAKLTPKPEFKTDDIEGVSDKVKEFGEFGVQAAHNVQDAFAEAFMAIGTGGSNLDKTILDAFRRMWAEIFALSITKALGLQQLMENLANQIANVLKQAFSGGSSGVGSILSGLVGAFFGGATASTTSAPVVASTHGPFAAGTSSAPAGWAMVGETGPELARLPGGTQVYNARETAAMMGGDRKYVHFAPSTNLNVYGTGAVTREELVEVMARNNRQQFEQFNRVMADNGVALR